MLRTAWHVSTEQSRDRPGPPARRAGRRGRAGQRGEKQPHEKAEPRCVHEARQEPSFEGLSAYRAVTDSTIIMRASFGASQTISEEKVTYINRMHAVSSRSETAADSERGASYRPGPRFAMALRNSRSLAFTIAALSRPMRIMIFSPAERFSRSLSANS